MTTNLAPRSSGSLILQNYKGGGKTQRGKIIGLHIIPRRKGSTAGQGVGNLSLPRQEAWKRTAGVREILLLGCGEVGKKKKKRARYLGHSKKLSGQEKRKRKEAEEFPIRTTSKTGIDAEIIQN